MGQLQKELESFKKRGIQLVAISYDAVDVLSKFGRAEQIRYPLLSDPESKTIDAYKIRNKEASGRFAGIPHPGTFLVDREGIIRAKLFHERYQQRHQAEEIIAAAAKLPKPKRETAK